MNHGHPRARYGLRAVAAATVAVCALTHQPAWALALGKVTVISRLGEPLRAEVDLPSITEDEAASLQVRAAGLEAHRAANMELSAATSELRFDLQRKSDGRLFILVRSPKPLNDPFVEILLQADWSGGRLVRGYTLLIDPPTTRSRPVQTSAVSAPVASPPSSKPTESSKPSTAGTAERGAGTAAVRPGDTTSQVAERHLPEGVTRDQMMLGLLKANPNAFYGNNVNRLKAGSVLKLPQSTELTAISPEQAKSLMAVQNREFNEYRRALASSAVASAPDVAPRQATGAVQAEAVVAAPAAPAQDKLELSKAEVPPPDQAVSDAAKQPSTGTGDSEQQLAQAMARIEQLTRDIEALKQQKAAPASVTPTPSTASTLTSALLDQPLLPALGAALVALLGWLGWRLKSRKTGLHGVMGDSSIFGTAKGQSVDTRAEAPVSSMLYSPSQLDAGGDVDPIAEADVYLAYGRDGQAEEILLDALLQQPDRIPVRLKLLDIYAQRKDPVAYGQAAAELSPMMAHASADWQHICSVGRTLDPENTLYQDEVSRLTPKTVAATVVAGTPLPESALSPTPPAAAPVIATPTPAPTLAMEPLPPISAPETPATSPATVAFELPAAPVAPAPAPSPEAPKPAAADMSLDFDLSQFGTPAASPVKAPVASSAPPEPIVGKDFDLDLDSLAIPPAAAVAAPATLPEDIQSLSLDLDLGAQQSGSSAPPTSTAKASTNSLDIDFDLDLTGEAGNDDPSQASHHPLEIKLSLAKEFAALGDVPGARALVQTVIEQSEGELQQRARDLLAQWS